jgi:hypothetical protein
MNFCSVVGESALAWFSLGMGPSFVFAESVLAWFSLGMGPSCVVADVVFAWCLVYFRFSLWAQLLV